MTDVFLMIRRKKSTIFLSCKETDTVAVLKKMLSGIVRQDAEGMKVFQQCDNAEKGKKPDIQLKNHVKCILPRIGQCCIHGIPWFSIEHVQADVSWSNRPRLEW